MSERWGDERLREGRSYGVLWIGRGRREEVHGCGRVGREGHGGLCVIVLWARIWVGSSGRRSGLLRKVADG